MQTVIFHAMKVAYLETNMSDIDGAYGRLFASMKRYYRPWNKMVGFTTSPMDAPLQDMQFSVGMQVSMDFNESKVTDPQIKFKVFNTSKSIQYLYKGAYGNISPAYTALREEMKLKNYRMLDYPLEIYLTNPMFHKPENNKTKVVFLVE